jgi:hypothetical protein
LQIKLNAVKRRGGVQLVTTLPPETTLTMGADYSTSSYIRDDNDDDDVVVVVFVVAAACGSQSTM